MFFPKFITDLSKASDFFPQTRPQVRSENPLPHAILVSHFLNDEGSRRGSVVKVVKTRRGGAMCAMVKSRVLLGMADLPPLIGNPYNGYINRLILTIPYYMEIMGV